MINDKKQRLSSFLSSTYAERKLIVVDRTATDCRELQARSNRAVNLVHNSLGFLDTLADIATTGSPVVYIARKVAIKAVKAAIGSDSSAAVGDFVMVIGRKEAATLQFPPGHPQDNTVYAGHPLIAKAYFPVSAFHRFLFEHKVTEAIRLLMSLGAKTMLVEHVDGWSKQFAGSLNLPIPQADGTASLSASAKRKAESSILFHAKLRGLDNPTKPNGMLWFPYEATWQQLCDGRINFGLQQFSLAVCYSDDLGVNANLTAKLNEMALGIGGQFEGFKKTTWKIEGAFA